MKVLQRWLLPLVFLAAAHAGAFARELVFAVGRQPLSLPVHVAEAEGYFRDAGVALRIADCSFGRLCLKELLDGRAQLATVADAPIMFASFGAADRFAIAATLATTRNDTKIVARRASGIRSAADLAGRKVGTFPGTTAHYFLDLVNLYHGTDPAAVPLVTLQSGEDGIAALRSGRVDAVAMFEPFAYGAVRALGDEVQVFAGNRLYQTSWNLVAARGESAPRDDELQAVLRALDRAVQLIARDPSRARAVMRARLDLDAAALDWVWPDMAYELTLGQSLLVSLEGQARWAQRNGHASGRVPNFLHLMRRGPLESVRRDAVTIGR